MQTYFIQICGPKMFSEKFLQSQWAHRKFESKRQTRNKLKDFFCIISNCSANFQYIEYILEVLYELTGATFSMKLRHLQKQSLADGMLIA